MASSILYTKIFLQDSLSTPVKTSDTALQEVAIDTSVKTIKPIRSNIHSIRKDSLPIKSSTGKNQNLELLTDSVNEARLNDSLLNLTQIDSSTIITYKYTEPTYTNFQFYERDLQQFGYRPIQVFTEKGTKGTLNQKKLEFEKREIQSAQLNWALLICLINIIILLIIKTGFQKFLNQVVNSIVNFQLADKMLREKNVITRRAFLLLNANFLLVIALFFTIYTTLNKVSPTGNYFLDFLLIAAIVLVILLLRIFIYFLSGYIFNTQQASTEYVHNIYLINKNLGLLFLPIVFAAIYTEPAISKIILIVGLVILGIAALFKFIRGFQIIMKNGVLLFYSILYLCTLELLPLAIGYKLFKSL